MPLADVPFEKRTLLAVGRAGHRSESRNAPLLTARQVKPRQNPTGPDGTLVAGALGIWTALAGSRRRIRRQALGILPVTREEAGVFTYPDGHPSLGTVYAVHPYAHDIYYPLTEVHGYLLRAWIQDLADLLRAAGAGCLLVQAADTAGRQELRSALGLPLVTEPGVLPGQPDAGLPATRHQRAEVAYRWKRQGPPRVDRTASPLSHPLLSADPLILDIVRTLFDGTAAEASATLRPSRDFGYTQDLVSSIEEQGFEVGGAFRQHVATRLVVRVARDPEAFARDA
ncbi:hypothetical protein ACFYYR_15470 [Streptomyces sp. NPDC001922]|uniref:hypothetical protein n=1 Tax=Streptomyces sp. NPDC001922 TaxID=3364624 RepID=UPI0036AD0A03